MKPDSPQLLDVSGRICVTPPYFALTDLRQTAPGEVTASIPVETDPGLQATGISLFEAARHLSNLGLAAASTINRGSGRHYYLANTGDCHWLAPALRPGTPPTKTLQGHAQATFTDSRHATARTQLTDGAGTTLARLTVAYDVLSDRLFTHFFGRPSASTPRLHNPYSQPLPLDDIEFHRHGASAKISVTPELCAGHFDGYPALPASVTAAAMTTLIDHLVARENPSARWRPAAFHFEAAELAWAGTTMTVTVTPTARTHTSCTMNCTAQINDKVVTTTNVDIEVHEC
ncbi:hypothetical protein ABZ922_44800 [Streptomyces shenzhenensis]|uniref:hypothetical protein n=1 Tax=Streptomyces shenzhenensis TaxID=943815 RepID=UPI00340E7DE0